MTEPLFFDNDCIAAFLWVGEQSILAQMYPGRIVIPQPVYDELSAPGIKHLRARIDLMIEQGQAVLRTISTASETYSLYYQMTQEPRQGYKIIGNGEASCLALAKEENGIIASNNLRDICGYIDDFGIQRIATGDIMVEAFRAGLISEDQGNIIWDNMIKKRRKIGADSFIEYLQTK